MIKVNTILKSQNANILKIWNKYFFLRIFLFNATNSIMWGQFWNIEKHSVSICEKVSLKTEMNVFHYNFSLVAGNWAISFCNGEFEVYCHQNVGVTQICLLSELYAAVQSHSKIKYKTPIANQLHRRQFNHYLWWTKCIFYEKRFKYLFILASQQIKSNQIEFLTSKVEIIVNIATGWRCESFSKMR